MGVLATATAAGCAAEPCTQGNDDAFGPSASVECPSGTLCYQGECVLSCNAGAELFDKCESDDDCTDSARPNCVDRYCSACDPGLFCVPTLNLCMTVRELPSDGGARDATTPRATTPQDGGWIDGSVFRQDSGVAQQTQTVPASHVGLIDISQSLRYVGLRTVQTTSISVVVRDVRGRGRTESATVTDPVIQNTHRCDLLTHETYASAPPSADLGPIRFENQSKSRGLIGAPYGASFDARARGYLVTPRVPHDLLVHSSTAPAHLGYVDVIGLGKAALTVGTFGGQDPNHVPHALSVDGTTRTHLVNGFRVDRPPSTPLTFRWRKPGEAIFRGVHLAVRIAGPLSELRCEALEEKFGIITVPTTMLSQFIDHNQLQVGDRRELVFERVFGRRVPVPSDVEGTGVKVDLSVRIRHRHVADITF